MTEPVQSNAKKWPRAKNEWYVEPGFAVRFLIERERFFGPVYDPSAGRGTIPETFLAAGIDAIGTDLIERKPGASWFRGQLDYLHDHEAEPPPHREVVMNPPFYRGKGLEAFIRRSLSGQAMKVCAFVPASFIWGERRSAGLYLELPPSRVWPVWPRPSCPPGEFLEAGGKAEGGTENFAWVVWDMGTVGGTSRIHWNKRGALC